MRNHQLYSELCPLDLGDVLAQCQIHLVADDLFVVDFGPLGDGLVDQRIGILAVPLVFEIPGLMVDARAQVIDLVEGRADPFGQHHGGALHGMAKAGDRDEGLPLQGGAQHGHRVGVIEQDGVRAVLFHVADDVQHGIDGAQEAEDAAGPRVSPTLMSTPYFLGISMSCRQTSVLPARMVVSTTSAPLSASARSSVASTLAGWLPAAINFSTPFFAHSSRSASMSIKRDGCILQQRKSQDVAHKLAGKAQAACADKCDLRHSTPFQRFIPVRAMPSTNSFWAKKNTMMSGRMLIKAPAISTVKRPPRVSCVWKKASPTVSVVLGTFGI